MAATISKRTIQIKIHPTQYKQKPDEDEIEIIQDWFKTNGWFEIKIDELASALVIGHTVKNVTDGNQFVSSDVLFPDFDCDLNPENILSKCKKDGMLPNFAYYTFGNKPDYFKYRFVYLLPETVYNKKQYEYLGKQMLYYLGIADEIKHTIKTNNHSKIIEGKYYADVRKGREKIYDVLYTDKSHTPYYILRSNRIEDKFITDPSCFLPTQPIFGSTPESIFFENYDSVLNLDLLHSISNENAQLIHKGLRNYSTVKHFWNVVDNIGDSSFDKPSEPKTNIAKGNDSNINILETKVNSIIAKNNKSLPDNVAPAGHPSGTKFLFEDTCCDFNQLPDDVSDSLTCNDKQHQPHNLCSVQSKKSNKDDENEVFVTPQESNNESDPYKYLDNLLEIDTVKKHCQLFKDSTESKLDYKEYFLLATNIARFDNEELLSEFSKNYLKLGNRKFKRENFQKYNIVKCSTYCPHFEICHNNKTYNILDHLEQKLNERVAGSFDSMQSDVNTTIGHIIKTRNNKINILVAATGSSKTTAAIRTEIAHNQHQYITFALPNHQLKEEVYNNIDPSINKRKTLAIPDVYNKNEIEQLYYVNDYAGANEVLSETEEGRKFIIENKKPIQGLTLTTWKKLLLNYKNDKNPINGFDEDPLPAIIESVEVDLDEVRDFMVFIDDPQLRVIIKTRLDMMKKKEIWKFHAIEQHTLYKFGKEYKNYVREHVVTTNILAFIRADIIANDENHSAHIEGDSRSIKTNTVHCYIDNRNAIIEMIKLGKTIFILSATINPEFYKLLFGEDLIMVYEINPCKQVATIEQFAECTMSASKISNAYSKSISDDKRTKQADHIKNIDDQIRDDQKQGYFLITTKEQKSKFGMKSTDPHLGNCSGYNFLANVKKAIIRGKLVASTQYVAAIAWFLNPNMSYEQVLTSKKRKVFGRKDRLKYKGKLFPSYYTYVDVLFREIDMHFTWSILKQAIGRFRPLTNTCHIKIYNDFIM